MTEQPSGAGGERVDDRAGLSAPKHHESAARRGESGSNRGDADPDPDRRTDGGHGDGLGERIRQVQAVVVWPESLIIGVTTWLVGLFLTLIPLWWYTFSEGVDGGTLDLAVWVYVEGVGGTIGDEVLFVTEQSTYGTLSSNAFGLGPVVHALIPVLVLCLGGYVLAGRHLAAGRARRPLETILAGGSLALWFTLTMVIAAVLASGNEFSVNLGETLVTTLLYAGVFTAVGAAVRSRARLTSAWGLLAGTGAVLAGLVAWLLVEDPFDDTPGVDGFSDLEWVLGYTRFLRQFVAEHGTGANEILPAWFVVVVPLLFGGVLAYAYERRDPILGFGEGARLGVTYAMFVFLIVAGHIAAGARELERTSGAWSGEEVDMVNELIAVAPRGILLGGIVYPVVFAALGGGVGTAVFDAVRRRNERGQRERRTHQQRPQDSAPPDQHQQEHGRQSGHRPSDESAERPSNRSTQEPPPQPEQLAGTADGQPTETDDEGATEPDGTGDEVEGDVGEADDEGEPEQSGDTLSPGEIISDKLDEDDTGDSQ